MHGQEVTPDEPLQCEGTRQIETVAALLELQQHCLQMGLLLCTGLQNSSMACSSAFRDLARTQGTWLVFVAWK